MSEISALADLTWRGVAAGGVILSAVLTRFGGERESELLHERVRRERAEREKKT
jgi:hypothetical protein